MKDFYEILEVHPKASMEIIKKAYYTLAKKYHPDTTSFDKRTAEIKMIELNEAYSVLSNPEKRSEYDKKLFSSNTTNSNNDSNSNKQAHSQSNNSYDDSLENTPAGRFIFNAGKEILDVLNTQIIRKNGNEFNNRKICDNLNEKIENHLITATNVISDSSGYKKNIYYMLGLVYWQMAVAYTWTDSRHEPIKYIDLANKYISNDMDYYTNYQKTRNAIVQNEKILQQNEEAERKRKKVAFIKLAIIILLILGGCIYENSTASNNKSTSQSKSPVQTQQIKQPQAPQNINEKPIAKNGVITGYDPMQLILNEDGLSSLTIDNTNNDMPVYVRIWSLDSGEPVRAFYIRQGDMFTADSLTAGTYEVRYKELYENDVKSKASKSEPIVLEEYTIGRTTHYSNMSLTLYKVRNGNTTTTGIDEDDV